MVVLLLLGIAPVNQSGRARRVRTVMDEMAGSETASRNIWLPAEKEQQINSEKFRGKPELACACHAGQQQFHG